MMDSFCIVLILGIVTTLLINNSDGIYHQRAIRALDFPTQWRPVAVPAANEHLISIANFDSTNKAQLAQIAHHNAQILRQIKGLHPPVTQYHNPFPMYHTSGNGNGGKNVFVHTNIIHPSMQDSHTNNLLTSSSNVAQTIVPHSMKHNFVSQKPSFMGKPEMNSPFKFLNSIHTSTSKIPGLIKTVSVQPNYPIYASTTSRVPIRDVTLTPPPSYRSTQKPHPVVNKFNAHLALSSRTKSPVMSASNYDAFSIPGQILSSFTHFAPPSHIIRDNKPRVSNNFLSYPIEQPFSNTFTGHLVPSGHFVSKNHFTNSLRYPQNSLSSVYSPQSQHSVHLNHPSPQLQQLQQQIGQTHQLNVQQHKYEKPKEQQHLTEIFHSQVNANSNSNHETENQYHKPPVSSVDNSQDDGSYLPPLPSVPPSVLSPFFQQIQQQQQQQQQQQPSTTTESSTQSIDQHHHFPNAYDLYNNNQDIQYSNFKVLHDEFTSSLVPPPFKHRDTSQFRDKSPSSSVASHLDVEQIKAIDILNKYNIPAISPLQDANRYAYNSRPVLSTETSNIQRPTEKQFGTAASFTTEKPNIFQNLNRPAESEHKQHKLMHPGYTGLKRPSQSTIVPFLPTPHSHDMSVSHSFFTIEDAITLSPKHSYRPIIAPTNTDQIEEIIRKPVEEEITEIITLSPIVNNDLQENNRETTSQPILETSTRLRGRGNKIRRRRPKPSTEANDDIQSQGQWETVKTDGRPKIKDSLNRYTNYKEAAVEEVPKDEGNESFGNFNRNRFRGRPSTTVSTIENNVTDKPSRGRRPLIKTRQRTSSQSTPTVEPLQDNDHTTIDFNNNLLLGSNRSRRPSTTLQTFSNPSTNENIYKEIASTHSVSEDGSSEPIETNQPMRTRIYTTAMANHNFNFNQVDSTEAVNTIEAHPEENSVIISTKAAFNEVFRTNPPEPDTTMHVKSNTFPVDETVFTTQQQHVSSSAPSSTPPSTTLKPSDDSSEKTGLDNIRHRQRLRYKEKLKDVHSSTASTTTTEIPIEKTIEDNEVTDDRVNVRLSMITTPKSVDEDIITAPTLSTNKLTRLNSINKFDSRNRPRFSVKDYRQRLSTSSTTEPTSVAVESTTSTFTRLRFPTRTRLLPDLKSKSAEKTSKTQVVTEKSSQESSDTLNKSESSQESVELSNESTTRKRFSPKDRYSSRVKSTENPITTTTRPTTRSRGSTRRDFGSKARQSSTTALPIERTVSRAPTIRNATYPLRRPQNVGLRQRIQNHHKTTKEPTINDENDMKAEMTIENKSDEISTEDYKQETAIMKIAKDDHSYRPYKASDEMIYSDSENDLNGSPSEQSERVAELAIFDNFSSVNTGSASRRIPGYFTIATEDPILPIEAFFPQVKRD